MVAKKRKQINNIVKDLLTGLVLFLFLFISLTNKFDLFHTHVSECTAKCKFTNDHYKTSLTTINTSKDNFECPYIIWNNNSLNKIAKTICKVPIYTIIDNIKLEKTQSNRTFIQNNSRSRAPPLA